MSNDLISRSAVIKIIEDEMKEKLSYTEHNAQIDILFKVKEMPTAYDVDGVLEQLEETAFIPGDRIGVSETKIIFEEKAKGIVKSGLRR